jgi:hypothetical protein
MWKLTIFTKNGGHTSLPVIQFRPGGENEIILSHEKYKTQSN